MNLSRLQLQNPKSYSWLWILFLLGLYSSIWSQDEALSPELDLQGKMIDALKEESIGNTNKAIEAFEKLSQQLETRATAFYYLARLYKSQSRHEEAIKAIIQCTQADPKNSWFWVYQANLMESYSDYPEAAKSYEKLIGLDSENYTFYDNAAYMYMKAKMPDQALKLLDLAQKKFGAQVELSIKKSEVFCSLNKQNKAIEALEQSLALFPGNAALLAKIIPLYELNYLNDKANEARNTLKIKEPYHPLISQNSKQEQSKTSSSIDLNNPNIGIDQKVITMIPLLDQLIITKDPQLQKEILDKTDLLISQYPKDSKPYSLKGDTYFALEQYRSARQAYQKAAESGRVPFTVWDHLIYSLLKTNEWNSLELYCNKALDEYPNQSFLYYALAESFFQRENYQDALAQTDQLLLMVQNNASKKSEALILKAKILSAEKKWKEADVAWDKAKAIHEKDLFAIEYNSYLICEKNEKPINWMDAFSSTKINEDYKQFLLAKIYYCTKEYTKSKELLQQLIQNPNKKTPEVILLLSKVYLVLGEPNEAKQQLLKGQEIAEYKKPFETLLQSIKS
ncbi:MAG TPA: hypothetical protein PK006_03735 [Saprospiraceae bacterium]|nr:hypothetical protein [Saprospiraceae bacterium]